MAESEDLELKHRTAAKGSENSGRESRQKMPARESKGERQPPVYQSDRSLRDRCRESEQASRRAAQGWPAPDPDLGAGHAAQELPGGSAAAIPAGCQRSSRSARAGVVDGSGEP